MFLVSQASFILSSCLQDERLPMRQDRLGTPSQQMSATSKMWQGGSSRGPMLGSTAIPCGTRLRRVQVLAQLGAAGNLRAILIANTWFDDARQHVRPGEACTAGEAEAFCRVFRCLAVQILAHCVARGSRGGRGSCEALEAAASHRADPRLRAQRPVRGRSLDAGCMWTDLGINKFW